MEQYLKLCNTPVEKEKLYFSKKNKTPKVSIISPVYNRDKYLSRFLKSIWYQQFNDIEIVLIDDFSSDNSLNLIKLYKNLDKRIQLIQNKKNYGTFKSRNLGILASKGEYAILPDPDDIFSQNSLRMFYNYAVKYDYEMLRFNMYFGNNNIFLSHVVNHFSNRPVFQPELKTFSYYASGICGCNDYNVANKFIKRLTLIKALNLLEKEYLNIYMITYEDQLLNFILYRIAKSFSFLKKIGYYYIINPQSIVKNECNSNDIKNIFINLKIIFDYSKNNKYEKDMFNSFFEESVIAKSIINRTHLMNNDKKYYIDAIDIFSKNDFISFNCKDYMVQMKKKINET